MTIYSISIAIVSAIIKEAIYPIDKLKEKLFIKNKDGEIFDYEGNSIDKNVINNVTEKMISDQNSFSQSLSNPSPNKDLNWALHLEHTPEIIGWCALSEDDYGLKCDPVKVTCSKAWGRIKSGELQGFSIGGIIAKSICSICDSDYTECNHISGTIYNDKTCCCKIQQFDIAEISIVKTPANKLANIHFSKEI